MTEIPPPPPADPKPFAPAAPRASSGCQKPILVGCGILTLLLGVAGILFVVRMHDVLAFFMDQLRAQVAAQLPDGVDESSAGRLDESFRLAVQRIREKKIDPVALQALQQKIVAITRSGGAGRMSAAQLGELQRALDAFNGRTAVPPEPGSPAAAPDAGSAEPPPGV